MPKFKVEGRVVRVSDGGGAVVVSRGATVKEAASAAELREAWERDMRIVFPQGPDYDMDYHCTVTRVEAEPIGVADAYASDHTPPYRDSRRPTGETYAKLSPSLAPSWTCRGVAGSERSVGKSRLLAAGYGKQLEEYDRQFERELARPVGCNYLGAFITGILIGVALVLLIAAH